MFSRTPILLIALITATTVLRGSVPIDIRAGRGVNRAAIKLLKDAEEQLKTGDVEKAQHSIDAALRSDPTFWPALYTRAKLFFYKHKCELAVQDCNEALRQNRTFIEAALLRAGANACLGKYADALKEINHRISIQPPQGCIRPGVERPRTYSGHLSGSCVPRRTGGRQRRDERLQTDELEG